MKIEELWQIDTDRKVYLFGAGERGRDFYSKYKEQLDIEGCFDNHPQGDFYGLPVLKPVSKRQAFDDHRLIIVCSFWEEEMGAQLVELGYTPFIDFLNVRYFEQFLEKPLCPWGKKLALFYGTCHIDAVMDYMRLIPAFNNQYSSLCIHVYSTDICDIQMADMLLPECDLLIYEKYFGNPVDKKKSMIKAKVVSIPQLMFWAYWPQTDIKNNQNIYWQMEKAFHEKRDSIIYAGDNYINQMLETDKSEDEIIEWIMSNKVVAKGQVLESLRKNFQNIRIAEKSSDIKIFDYISSNYQKEKIYKDYIHLNGCLMKEYAERIIEYLGIDRFTFKEYGENLSLHAEMPIYPCVAQYLGLEMIDDKTRYYVRRDDHTFYTLTFEEYEREYIRRCKRLRDRN